MFNPCQQHLKKNRRKTYRYSKPNITLTTEKIEIFKGEDIAYEKYIKEAMDDKDGDLSGKVNFNKIDANEVGRI